MLRHTFSFLGDCGETLELPPSYEIDDRSAPYWLVHFLDAPGMLLPGGLVEQNQCLLLAWCYILSTYSKVCTAECCREND